MSHLGLLEDVPANMEAEGFLSDLARHMAGGHETVAPLLAVRMGAHITRRAASGNRDPDWREEEYVVTELKCMGATYCLLESGGDAAVVRESIDSIFAWLDASHGRASRGRG